MSIQLTQPINQNDPPVFVPWTWDGPSANDWIVRSPLAKLRAKYFYGHTSLSLEFDLYTTRQEADPEWADRLDGTDLTATMLMNSQIESWDVVAVLGNRPAIESALRRVPRDLALADADLADPGLRSALLDLFRAFRLPRVSIAKVTKALCLKRPRLIPMIDSYVLGMLYDDVPAIPTDPDAFAHATFEAVGYFQTFMHWPTPGGGTNLAGLVDLAGRFTAEAKEHLGRTGRATAPAITPVRVLDNLLWFENGGFTQCGYVRDEATRELVVSDGGDPAPPAAVDQG